MQLRRPSVSWTYSIGTPVIMHYQISFEFTFPIISEVRMIEPDLICAINSWKATLSGNCQNCAVSQRWQSDNKLIPLASGSLISTGNKGSALCIQQNQVLTHTCRTLPFGIFITTTAIFSFHRIRWLKAAPYW